MSRGELSTEKDRVQSRAKESREEQEEKSGREQIRLKKSGTE